MTNTLPETLLAEIRRNRELLDAYREIGPLGAFAYAAISADIERAENVLASGDAIEMMRWLQTLRENE